MSARHKRHRRQRDHPDVNSTITATLIDAEHVEAAGRVRKYKRPVYDLARALIKERHDPETILVTRWGHRTPSFKPAPLWKFARWTVTERDRQGLRLERYKEWPGKVRGQPVQRGSARAA